MTAAEFRQAVLDAYPMVQNLIGQDAGLKLQREESDLAERVMLHFVRQGHPILPRLLGIGHIFWIPMIVYFLGNLPDKPTDPALYCWVVLLISFIAISLIIDAIDVTRFVRGERSPHYVW